MTINFSGTAGQVREAFGTEIHALEVKGVRHIANVRDPQIPAALAPVVEGIVSLHDFRPRPMVHKSQYTIPPAAMPFYAVAPADLATIYRFNPLFSAGITGKGQTIALIGDSDLYAPDNWNTFRRTFGLEVYSEASLETVHPGGCPDPGINPDGDDLESAVDVEWASAAAPSADIRLASCANTTTVFGGLIAIQNLLSQHDVPHLISVSYAECETANGAAANAAYKAAYQQAVLEGVSVFVAAGDNGAAICDIGSTVPVQYGIEVNAFASTVYDVAVGGTDFGDYYAGTTAKYWSPINGPNDRSVLSYVPEIAWNDTCASTLISNYFGFTAPDSLCASAFGATLLGPYAGSGGPSNCATGVSVNYIANNTCRGWKKPSWQAVLGNPDDGVRDLPDVSMFAADGVWDHAYVYCNSDPATGAPCVGPPSAWSLAGGTSFSSPIMAGVQALVNQVWRGPQGNPAPVYYAIARRTYGKQGEPQCQTFVDGGPASTCTFHDVTTGDNDVDCTGPYSCYSPDADAGGVGVLSLSDHSYQPAYLSGVGWDFATGIGTVSAANLVLDPIWAEGSSE
jgi:subtilase family serine protease